VTCPLCDAPMQDGGQSGDYCPTERCPNSWYGTATEEEWDALHLTPEEAKRAKQMRDWWRNQDPAGYKLEVRRAEILTQKFNRAIDSLDQGDIWRADPTTHDTLDDEAIARGVAKLKEPDWEKLARSYEREVSFSRLALEIIAEGEGLDLKTARHIANAARDQATKTLLDAEQRYL
jgi:hypothetical protein